MVLRCARITLAHTYNTRDGRCAFETESLQGDVRFAEVNGLMGSTVQWAPYSNTITGSSSAQEGQNKSLDSEDRLCRVLDRASCTLKLSNVKGGDWDCTCAF